MMLCQGACSIPARSISAAERTRANAEVHRLDRDSRQDRARTERAAQRACTGGTDRSGDAWSATADRSIDRATAAGGQRRSRRSEEHTSELQSLMRISYAVFCLKQKKQD